MSNETILLTGATGFLGSHLMMASLKQDYDIIILKRRSSDTRRIENLLESVRVYNCDQGSIDRVFEENKVDIICHAATNYGRKGTSFSQVASDNLLFSLLLLEAGLKNQVSTFINTHTLQSKYLNAYTLTKTHFCEWFDLIDQSMQIINLKIEHMYGPGDDANKFPVWFLDQLQAHVPEIALTEGTQQRDFVYIDDVVSAFMQVLSNRQRIGQRAAFEVGTGTAISVRDFVIQLKNAYGAAATKQVNSALAFGKVPVRKAENARIVADISKLENLGWKPRVDIESGLKKFVHSYTGDNK